jgi:hypothetical protein
MAVLPAAPRGLPLCVRGWEGFSDGLADGEVMRVLTGNAVDWGGGGCPAAGAVWARWRLEPVPGAADGAGGLRLIREQRGLSPLPDGKEPGDGAGADDGPLLDRILVCDCIAGLELIAVRPEPADAAAKPPSAAARGPSYPAACEVVLKGATAGGAEGFVVRRAAGLPVLSGRNAGEFDGSLKRRP